MVSHSSLQCTWNAQTSGVPAFPARYADTRPVHSRLKHPGAALDGDPLDAVPWLARRSGCLPLIVRKAIRPGAYSAFFYLHGQYLPARLVNDIYKYLVHADLTMNKMIIIIASVIAALVVIVLLIYFLYSKKGSSDITGGSVISVLAVLLILYLLWAFVITWYLKNNHPASTGEKSSEGSKKSSKSSETTAGEDPKGK
ncbi:UNVERIFIED_CONTAM: hypothetical protein PYX00_011611 [Menopon gallinae]|uniref:Uncharacterized protein n=1 Tax=Menopon gallinae TaxID=328185 RepID=A0AAW2H853_9NEOP